VIGTVLAMSKTRIALIALVLLTGACGADKSDASKDQVASLASAPPAATSAKPSPANDGRPQLRMDSSDEEANRLFTAYEDCLVAHGVKINMNQPAAAGTTRILDRSGEPKAAYTACAGKLPRQPPEMDAERNPNFEAQWNDNVRCLRAHGLMVHATEPGSWTWDGDGSPIPENSEKIQDDCEKEAFGAGK